MNAELDKTEIKKKNTINGKRILSTEKEYYQVIRTIKKILKAFQNFVTIFKINSIGFSFFLFLFLHVGLLGFVVVAYQFCVRL